VFVPYTVDVPMVRLPFANWGLIGVTSIISMAILFGVGRRPESGTRPNLEYLLQEHAANKTSQEDLRNALLRYADDMTPPLALRPGAFSVTQLVTYTLVHGNILHLLGNMVFLFVFGNAVNAKLGHAPFLACYFGLGALGGLAWLLLGSGQPMVGASGAIMGIVGIFFVFFPLNDVRTVYWLGIAGAGEFSLPSYVVILFYFACDLWGALAGGGGGVAYVTHLGGAFGGMALAIGLVMSGRYKPTRYEENLLQVLGIKKKRRNKRD
jgi:membrane associated rhomboid family serine protease